MEYEQEPCYMQEGTQHEKKKLRKIFHTFLTLYFHNITANDLRTKTGIHLSSIVSKHIKTPEDLIKIFPVHAVDPTEMEIGQELSQTHGTSDISCIFFVEAKILHAHNTLPFPVLVESNIETFNRMNYPLSDGFRKTFLTLAPNERISNVVLFDHRHWFDSDLYYNFYPFFCEHFSNGNTITEDGTFYTTFRNSNGVEYIRIFKQKMEGALLIEFLNHEPVKRFLNIKNASSITYDNEGMDIRKTVFQKALDYYRQKIDHIKEGVYNLEQQGIKFELKPIVDTTWKLYFSDRNVITENVNTTPGDVKIDIEIKYTFPKSLRACLERTRKQKGRTFQ